MILQSLYSYYQRKRDLPREGFEEKEIPFIIGKSTRTAQWFQIEDTRTQEEKKRAKQYRIPQGAKKSVNVAANLLWGNAEYVLGLPDSKKLAERMSKGKELEYRDRLKEMRTAFIKEIESLPPPCQIDPGIRAVLKFCEHTDFTAFERFGEVWREVKASNLNMTFRLQGNPELVCHHRAITEAVSRSAEKEVSDGMCLITGDADEIERLHPAIKGVWGAQTSGANIISFNLPAFNSWGKNKAPTRQ